MAKFCTQCGTAVDETSAFCTHCGTPQTTQSQQAPQRIFQTALAQPVLQQPDCQSPQSAYPVQPAYTARHEADTLVQKKPKKRVLKPLVIVLTVAALAVTAALVYLLFVRPPYKTALDNFYAKYHGDVDAYKSDAPDELWDDLADEMNLSGKELDDLMEEYVEWENEKYEMRMDTFQGGTFSYNIEYQQKLGKDAIEEIEDLLNERYYTDFDIDKAYRVEVDYEEKGADGRRSGEETLFAVKIDDEWYMLYANIERPHYNSDFTEYELERIVGVSFDGVENLRYAPDLLEK